RADLVANTKRCILAYWQHPLFSSSGSAFNSSIKPLWDDLYAAHADIAVNGHYQVYERFAPQTPAEVADPDDGIRQFTVGTGGVGAGASVSPSGVALGLAEGAATITATSEGRSGSSALTVTAPPPGSPLILVGAGDIADCSSTRDEATAALLDNIPGTVFANG